MLSVHISNYGCTQEVWRAREKRKSCPRHSGEELWLLECSPKSPSASIAKARNNSLEHCMRQTHVVIEKKRLLELRRVYQVIVFYSKTMNKGQGKHDQEIFRDQIFIQRIVNLLLRSEKRTNFFHVRGHVVDSACLNRCLLKFATRKLRRLIRKLCIEQYF